MKQKRASRSLWWNYALLVLAAVVEAVPDLQQAFPAWSRGLLALAAVVNIILRHATTEPLVPMLPPRPPAAPPPTEPPAPPQ
jgi:hypothetical protein